VRAGEGANAVLLTLGVFLLLMAYYIIKVVREPLILASGGAEAEELYVGGPGPAAAVPGPALRRVRQPREPRAGSSRA